MQSKFRNITSKCLSIFIAIILISSVAIPIFGYAKPALAQTNVDNYNIAPAESLTLNSGSAEYFFVGSTAGGYLMNSMSWSSDLNVIASYSNNLAISIGHQTSTTGSYYSTAGNHGIAGVGVSGFGSYSIFPASTRNGDTLSTTFTVNSNDLVLILVGGEGDGNLSLSGITAQTLVDQTYSEAGSNVIASEAIYEAQLPAGTYNINVQSITYPTNGGTSLGLVVYDFHGGTGGTSSSNLSDNFVSDASLNTNLWQINGPVGSVVGPSVCGGCAMTNPQVSFSSGLDVTGIDNYYQVATIETKSSFSLPFTAEAHVMGTSSYGNTFFFAASTSDGSKGIAILGNLNSGNGGYYGINIDTSTGTAGQTWNGQSKLYSSPQLNTPYDVTISVDATGQATVSVSSNGQSLGQATYQIGTGSFFIIMGQGEGAPITSGVNNAIWQSVSVGGSSSGGTGNTFPVTFTESGLQSGTSWSVTLNGNTQSSTSSSMIFNEPDGNYQFSVTPPSSYRIVPYSGSITVNGGPTSQQLTFVPPVQESGSTPVSMSFTGTVTGPITNMQLTLTSGTVTVGGTTYPLTGSPGQYCNQNNIACNAPNGVLSAGFIQLPNNLVLGFASCYTQTSSNQLSLSFYNGRPNTCGGTTAIVQPPSNAFYCPFNATGTLTVTGSQATITASGTGNCNIPSATFPVTFTESGLPSGTSWSVTLNGNTQSSTSSNIVFNEPNGSYPFTVTTNGYVSSPPSGTVSVSGGSVNEPIAFSQPFDFSMSLPSVQSVNILPGGEEQVPIAINLVSGQSQSVTLSSSNVIQGVNITFNPPSGTPPFTSTATVSASNTATPGKYQIQLFGGGGGQGHYVLANLDVGTPVFEILQTADAVQQQQMEINYPVPCSQSVTDTSTSTTTDCYSQTSVNQNYPVTYQPFYEYVQVTTLANTPISAPSTLEMTSNNLDGTTTGSWENAQANCKLAGEGQIPLPSTFNSEPGVVSVKIQPNVNTWLTYYCVASWNYVQPENTLVTIDETAAGEGLNFLNQVKYLSDIKAGIIGDFLEFFEFADQHLGLAVQFTPTYSQDQFSQPTNVLINSEPILVGAPSNKMEGAVWYLGAQYGGFAISSAMDGGALAALPLCATLVGCLVPAALFAGSILANQEINNWAYQQEADPSLNYTQFVTVPQPPESITSLQNTTAGEAIYSLYLYKQYIEASIESNGLAHGALLNNSTYYAYLQESRAREYANTASLYLTQYKSYLNQAIQEINSTGTNLDQNSLNNGKEIISTNGLPIEVNQILDDFNLTQDITTQNLEKINYTQFNNTIINDIPNVGISLAQEDNLSMNMISKNIIRGPTLIISSPSDNTLSNHNVINILGETNDTSGIRKVTVSIDGNEPLSAILHFGTNPTSSITWYYTTPPLVDGSHVIIVNSTANDGLSSLASVLATVDTVSPEAYLKFDPTTKDVILYGADSLSGIANNPISPVSVIPTKWGDDDNKFDNDTDKGDAQIRTYNVTDRAGNSLVLVEKVRTGGHEEKVRILNLQYNNGKIISVIPNEEKFNWSENKDHGMKELEQHVTADRDKNKQDIDAKYSSKDGNTTVHVKIPSKHDKDIKEPGLVLLHIATNNGTLTVNGY